MLQVLHMSLYCDLLYLCDSGVVYNSYIFIEKIHGKYRVWYYLEQWRNLQFLYYDGVFWLVSISLLGSFWVDVFSTATVFLFSLTISVFHLLSNWKIGIFPVIIYLSLLFLDCKSMENTFSILFPTFFILFPNPRFLC